MLSAVLCGVAGMLLANLTGFASPSTMTWMISGDLIVMIVLGGTGTVFGPLLGVLAFLGLEDLGGGLQAVFTLEAGLLMDTGGLSQGNRLFGRQASVGLKGDFGTVTIGRQVNMTFMAMLKSDVMGPNLFSISSIDLYIPNARSDNAVGYYSSFHNIVVRQPTVPAATVHPAVPVPPIAVAR